MRRDGTAIEAATAKDGQRLGRYRLLDLIGRDGDARLHHALDANGQAVALWTVPLARLCVDAAGQERFRRTASAVARLSHPAIPAILASGEHAGMAFVAAVSVEGRTLAERLADGPLEWNETVPTLDRVLSALDAAHRAGVVHGALDVGSILHAGPAAVLTGFGRAALTTAKLDRHNDLAAAARLTERLLAGHDERPDVAALLATLRDEGAGAFPEAGDLRRAVTALGIASVPPPVADPVRARRLPLWLGGVALVGGLVALAVLNRHSPSLPPALPPAAAMAEEVAPEPALQPTAPGRPPVAAVAEALRSNPCALVDVETSGDRLLVSGTVAGERAETAVRETVEALAGGWDHGFDLATAEAQFCAPLRSVAAALDANRELAEPLTVTVQDGPALDAGDRLVLEIRAPARPVQLQVDYFTIGGSVVHLLPNPSDSAIALVAGTSRRLGERGEDGKQGSGRSWTIGPPYGTEMLLTVATAAPLFPSPRPEQEPAADYLSALADALATLPDGAPPALADVRFIKTGP